MKAGRLALLVSLCSLSATPTFAASIVVNGGFEAPVVTATVGYEYRVTGDTGWGWTNGGPSRGTVQFDTNYQVGNLQGVGEGDQAVQLELAGDYIEQALATDIGQLYNLTFLFASFVLPGTSTLLVNIGGFSQSFTGNNLWTPYSVSFVGASTSTLLRFTNSAPVGQPYTYPHLDAIAVEAVPEPASLLLFGAGTLVLGAIRRRKSPNRR